MQAAITPIKVTPTGDIGSARAMSRSLVRASAARTGAEVARAQVMSTIFGPDLCASYQQRAHLQALIHAALTAAEAAGAADAEFHCLASQIDQDCKNA